MKILIFCLNYHPEKTGIGKYTGDMAQWFAARGHSVEVIAGFPHYPEWKLDERYALHDPRTEVMDGVHVSRAPHFIPAIEAVTALARIRLECSFNLSAARYWLPLFLRCRKPDVVVAVTPPLQLALFPALYCRLRSVPFVLHVQDLQVDAALELKMLRGTLLRVGLSAIEKVLLRCATRVSTITESMRARIVAKGISEHATWLLPNWADSIAGASQPDTRDNDFRKRLGISRDTILVMYAGNLGEKQGLEVVLQVAHLCRDDTDILFVIVGDGVARPRLQRLANELSLQNLRFIPLQPVDRVASMLAAGDVHLIIQRADASDLVMPSKLTNILAAGRVCVATANEGTTLYDVVNGHGTGVVVPPSNPAALARSVRSLARDPLRRNDYGARGRDFATRHLSRDVILRQFEARLMSLAESVPSHVTKAEN